MVAAHVKVEEIAEFLGGALAEVMRVVGEQGLQPAGPPFGRYGVTAGAPWECYLDGPEVPEPRTGVFIPCVPARPHHLVT